LILPCCPHPANRILRLDNKIAYIDFGMIGDLLHDEKILFRELVFCITTRDEERMFGLLAELLDDTTTPGMILPESVNILLQKIKEEDLVKTPDVKRNNSKLLLFIMCLYLIFCICIYCFEYKK